MTIYTPVFDKYVWKITQINLQAYFIYSIELKW